MVKTIEATAPLDESLASLASEFGLDARGLNRLAWRVARGLEPDSADVEVLGGADSQRIVAELKAAMPQFRASSSSLVEETALEGEQEDNALNWAKPAPEGVRKAPLADDLVFDAEARRIPWIMSDERVDHDGDIVVQRGIDMTIFRSSPRLLLFHDHRQLALGSVEKPRVVDLKGIPATAGLFEFSEDNPQAEIVFRMASPVGKDGKRRRPAINSASIGFKPKKTTRPEDDEERDQMGLGRFGVRFDKILLIETSVVNVGANARAVEAAVKGIVDDGFVTDADATAFLRGLTLTDKDWEKRAREVHRSFVSMSGALDSGAAAEFLSSAAAEILGEVVDGDEAGEVDEDDKQAKPTHTGPKAPESRAWSGPREVARATTGTQLWAIHAWRVTGGDQAVKASYKLPHHHVESGFPVSWGGVRAAMGALLGARGGVQVPAGDRRGIHAHLARHYRQFDKEPPALKQYGDLASDKRLLELCGFSSEEAKEELVLCAADRKDGTRCRGRRVSRGEFCLFHGGKAAAAAGEPTLEASMEVLRAAGYAVMPSEDGKPWEPDLLRALVEGSTVRLELEEIVAANTAALENLATSQARLAASVEGLEIAITDLGGLSGGARAPDAGGPDARNGKSEKEVEELVANLDAALELLRPGGSRG